MLDCMVYQDGKLGRGRPGKIIKKSAQRVLIEFTLTEYDCDIDDYTEVTKPRWFTRRRRQQGGVYECNNGWNYWFYGSIE